VYRSHPTHPTHTQRERERERERESKLTMCAPCVRPCLRDCVDVGVRGCTDIICMLCYVGKHADMLMPSVPVNLLVM
jgi:hypothetical protein